ncbi:MAG: hypothetical protein KDA21_09350, partial [Phycisphaerales bacterium]|nr:hypothetical protein [Phycisphaerales bacterium]
MAQTKWTAPLLAAMAGVVLVAAAVGADTGAASERGGSPPVGWVEAVFCVIPGASTAQVPGYPGESFGAVRRPYRSPDGRRWIMSPWGTGGLFGIDYLVVGDNLDMTVVLRENDAAPWAAGETINTMDEQCGINDAGQYAFSVNTAGGDDLFDEYVIRWTNGVGFVVVAQESTSFPAIPGADWGLILDEVHIVNDGRVGIRSINTYGLPSNQNTLCALGGATIEAQEGVTIPFLQGGGMETWESFDFYSFQHDATGSVSMVKGNMTGPTSFDHVCTVSNNIIVREGFFLTGFPNPITTTPSHQLGRNTLVSNGDWFFRGTTSGGGADFLLRNGFTYYRDGDPITPGSSELVGSAPNGDAFFFHTGNNRGQSVVGIYTTHPDDDLDEAVVFDKSFVLLRSGDAVDIDRNGAYDDDAYIAEFPWDEAFLTDAGSLYVNVILRNGAGATLGDAFIHVAVTPCLPGDLNRDGAVNFDDLNIVLESWGRAVLRWSLGDADGNGTVDFDDLNIVL